MNAEIITIVTVGVALAGVDPHVGELGAAGHQRITR